MPDFAANPTNVNTKEAKRIPGESVLATDMRVLQLRVPAPRLLCVNVNIKIKPMNENNMHVDVMKTYLRVAPMFLGALRITTRTAEKAVVNSANIQKSARLFEKNE